MGEGINGPPNNYDFGLEFDYSVWTPGTIVDLVNVPFNNDYRDVVKFKNQAELNAYIDGKTPLGISFDKLSYVKPNQPITLPKSHSQLVKYNYVRVSNPLQPIPGGDVKKYYYYFILDVEYVSPNASRLTLQLDVWQTYVYDLSLGQCFVERGHIGIANQNQFNNYGRDYLTVPEGHDMGSDYQTVTQRKRFVMSPTPWNQGPTSRYPSYDILIVSTVNLLADAGDADDPKLNTAHGGIFQGTIHGASFYVCNADTFTKVMALFSNKPWVTQGIISITMIPKITRYHPDFQYQNEDLTNAPAFPPANMAHTMLENWRGNGDIVNYIPERYRHLRKFWTSPYMVIELTTFMGTPIALKPEMWNSADAQIVERANLVPPAQRVEFYPAFYNSRYNSFYQAETVWPSIDGSPIQGYLADIKGDDNGEYIDLVTQIASFPTMAIVNNGAISYLASNHHGVTHQYRSNDWSQQRALAGNQAQYDIASGAMSANMANVRAGVVGDIAGTANQNRTLAAQAAVNASTQAASGIGQALTPGGFGGAAVSGIASGIGTALNAGIQTSANDEALGIRNRQAAETSSNTNRQAALMRDTNKSLSDWAARGDYSNQRDAIDAKVQDAALIQPTTSGQIGGETMNLVNGGWQISARWKMIDQARIRQIGEIWLRYGYAVHTEMRPPQTLHVMSKFTYWKMSETYIVSSMIPEGFKQAIRGILEKGVTVWVNPDDIGMIDWAENRPLDGIAY